MNALKGILSLSVLVVGLAFAPLRAQANLVECGCSMNRTSANTADKAFSATEGASSVARGGSQSAVANLSDAHFSGWSSAGIQVASEGSMISEDQPLDCAHSRSAASPFSNDAMGRLATPNTCDCSH